MIECEGFQTLQTRCFWEFCGRSNVYFVCMHHFGNKTLINNIGFSSVQPIAIATDNFTWDWRILSISFLIVVQLLVLPGGNF